VAEHAHHDLDRAFGMVLRGRASRRDASTCSLFSERASASRWFHDIRRRWLRARRSVHAVEVRG
jgi:hypothetical protein